MHDAVADTDAVARSRVRDVALIRRHREGDRLAREMLIRRYLPLARALARRYARAHEPMDDLVQVASLGLVKAVDRWDPDRGLAFSSFAVPTVLGELRRYFRDSTWIVRPPRRLQELSISVEHAREPLNAASGREPTVADLAERLGRSPDEVREAMQAGEGRWLHSLDSPVHEDQDDQATPGELIGDEDPGYELADARATVECLTSILDDGAREILRLRYEHDLLQSEIAERIGSSQMSVSRVIRSSLERLQAYAAAAA
jgi:RNA polymerase sigma-B factor